MIPREHREKLRLWAFGTTQKNLSNGVLLKLWNERHGDKLHLYLTDSLRETGQKMYALYLDSLDKET